MLHQIGALDAFCRAAGTQPRYVEPHGAPYHRCFADDGQAQAVVDAAGEHGLPVLGLPGSRPLSLAGHVGSPCITEAFADSAYTPAGTPVPRGVPGAVLTDVDEVAARAVRDALRAASVELAAFG